MRTAIAVVFAFVISGCRPNLDTCWVKDGPELFWLMKTQHEEGDQYSVKFTSIVHVPPTLVKRTGNILQGGGLTIALSDDLGSASVSGTASAMTFHRINGDAAWLQAGGK